MSYTITSPWHLTEINDIHLETLTIRPVPVHPEDYLYTVEPQYNHRPDLLAHDLYDNAKLWWVFAQRNMDVLKDPIFDLEPGVEIYIPRGPELRELLGL